MGTKILLVEDDAVARKSMERLVCSEPRLAALEPTVVQAASGQQGLAVFVDERPDLIVTDLSMPAMDGLAFCRSLRETPLGRDVPIIVVSGVYKDPGLAKSLDDEFQAKFLPKPIQVDDLVQTILGCLGVPSAEVGASDSGGDTEGRPVFISDQLSVRVTEKLEVAADSPSLPPVPPPLPPARRPTGPTRAPSRSLATDPIGSGSFAQKHLPKIVFEVADTQATGTLSLARGRVRKDLYIRNGQVVAADSNLRQEALGTLLAAKGVIDENQLAYLLSETKKRGHKMGSVLIELGWLTPEEVLQALAAQARKRILDCLRWEEGDYHFIPGDTFGERIIEHDLDLPKAIVLGLYRSATPETLVQRFDLNGACPVELTPRFGRYKSLFQEVFGGDVADVIASAPTVGALALREDAHVVMAEIDTLIETGLATLGTPAEETTAPGGSLEISFALEKLGAELNKRFDAILQDGPGMSFSEAPKADILPLPASPVRHPQEMDESVSGALDIGYQPEQPTGEQPSAVEELRQRILQEYLMLHGKSHYEVLEIAKSSTSREIDEAARAKRDSFSSTDAAELGPADRTRLGAIRVAIDEASKVLKQPAARAAYDRSLASKRGTSDDALGAELEFGQALQLFQANQLDEAVARFEAAVAARPDQALYHAYLGWAEFVAHGPDKSDLCRERLSHALVLDPGLAEAHAMLGRLAATEDDAPTARVHLEQSLTIAPEQPETVSLLLEAYTRLPEPDHRGAERFLRKLVSSLGDRAEPLRKRLWLELGSLYETKLSDRASARIAYDTAARLGPKNLDSVRKSLELNAEDPSRWRETAHALACEWQLHPHEAGPANSLLALFQQQRARDGVATTAAAMVLRGLADDSVRKLAEDMRPKALARIPGPLPGDLLVRAGYRGHESDLENLATLLVETAVLKPFSRDELGLLDSDQPMPDTAQPPPFRDVLEYICGLFQVGVPKSVINLPVLGGDARMADLRPPALLCGQMLLGSDDTVELGFRLSRAMALSAPGRLAGSSRSGRQMRPYFIAALALANAAGPVKDPLAVEAAKAISDLDSESRQRIMQAARAMKQKYDNLNLSVWGRGLSRVATRLALLVCGDLLRVGRAVAEEDGPGAMDDLLSFALSLEYIDLRSGLGFNRG